MAYAEYKHFFKVKDDGTVIFENDIMYRAAIQSCKNKRKPFMIIRNKEKQIPHGKYKFYFGIVIGKYCMNSNVFSGYTKTDIHKILFEDIRARRVKIKGNERLLIDKPFENYNDKDMELYVKELIPHLAVQYNIYIDTKDENYEYKS